MPVSPKDRVYSQGVSPTARTAGVDIPGILNCEHSYVTGNVNNVRLVGPKAQGRGDMVNSETGEQHAQQ